jgi:hypothetical protein
VGVPGGNPLAGILLEHPWTAAATPPLVIVFGAMYVASFVHVGLPPWCLSLLLCEAFPKTVVEMPFSLGTANSRDSSVMTLACAWWW